MVCVQHVLVFVFVSVINYQVHNSLTSNSLGCKHDARQPDLKGCTTCPVQAGPIGLPAMRRDDQDSYL